MLIRRPEPRRVKCIGMHIHSEGESCSVQGPTVAHFSAQPAPFLTENTSWIPPDTPSFPVSPPTHPLSNT